MSQKKNHEILRSSSSHSLSSNYGNQFLNASSDTSFLGIIKDHADTEINSLLDVQIQQEIPPVLSAPLLDVLVLVITPQTTTTTTPILFTTPLPTPPITITTRPETSPLPATETPDAPVPLSEALTVVLQRVSTLEKDAKEIKQVAHSALISESIKSQVPNALNEFLGLSLGDSLQKRKHDDQDEDPTIGLDQGKEKKRPQKDTQLSKKSFTSKESSKGKTSSKTSKSGKSMTTEEPYEEHIHDVSMDA
ncbi:hypothetical protein Tco_1548459 [Tanacetum coccineum]